MYVPTAHRLCVPSLNWVHTLDQDTPSKIMPQLTQELVTLQQEEVQALDELRRPATSIDLLASAGMQACMAVAATLLRADDKQLLGKSGCW